MGPERLSGLGELNRRILLRKDRDHQIGHAYFMQVSSDEEFNARFRRQVIPLLQEYFFNDWEGLKYVLAQPASVTVGIIRRVKGSDAKYKHLARGHNRPLRFQELFEQADENLPQQELAGRLLDAADIRQLTVYSSLAAAKFKSGDVPTLMLMYPFVGPPSESIADKTVTWNGCTFWLMPVQVKAQKSAAQAIRFPDVVKSTVSGPTLTITS